MQEISPLASQLELIWIGIIVLACASAWTTQAILFGRIKKFSYEKWVEIGEPGFKTAASLSFSKFHKFSLTLKYMFKEDAELDANPAILRQKKLVKLVYLLILIVVVIFFIAVFILDPA